MSAIKIDHPVPSYADVGRLIAPTSELPWLAALLRDWGPSLMLDRVVQESQPTKAAMKARLIAIKDAAALLQRSLNDTPTREFLEIEGRIQIENLGGLDLTLRVIAERADHAAASPAISAASGETKSGRGKAAPLESISAKAFCAVIIAETWAFVHGDYPAPRNLQAAAAADAYWDGSGGRSKGWGDNHLAGWSYHFKEVRSPAAERWRKEVRRHCIEYTH